MTAGTVLNGSKKDNNDEPGVGNAGKTRKAKGAAIGRKWLEGQRKRKKTK